MSIDRDKVSSEKFWALPADKVFESLATSRSGLTEMEAGDRLKEFGENTLPRVKRGSKIRILLSQFKSPLIFILLVAGIITLVLEDFKDSGFIFAAILVNAALGFYQENKAETALSNLKTYIKERVRVIRDGREKEIGAEEVVPGDLIRVVSGLRIPADARLVMVNELTVNEAVLTGESLPVSKVIEPCAEDATIADQESMIFSGTLVGGGTGLAVVTKTGKNTELGRIAALVKEKGKDKTPLQTAIAKFSLRVGIILFVLTMALFLIGIALGYGIFDMFLISVAVAVSAVPEGLPVALTVVLAVGVERLAKRKGVVRKLLAAEALGSTTLIMTDKTGTLTEARMELDKVISSRDHGEVLQFAILGTDVIVENPEDPPDQWRIVGRPLEAAVVRAGAKYKVFLPKVKKEHEILNEKPFNSTDKFSAAEIKAGSKKQWVYVGAPDILVQKTRLDKSEKEKLLIQIDEMAYSGYRVVGVALDDELLGLLAFNDPIRPTAARAIEEVERAGVKTVIVTGDHKGTALAVAKDLGMKADKNNVLTGEDIREMGDEELKSRIAPIRVFARVTPADKLRIVKIYQELGEIVAVTGDGVNDAPALEGADIGVSVGSGTDVAKGASDLVILDDNFETIVAAIGEGRRILDNIRKVIVYLFSDALDELILIGGSLIMGLPLPINALQILWVNFFDDSFPAVALAFEEDTQLSKSSPVDLRKRLIDKEMRFLILVIGIISSVILLVMYVFLLRFGFQEDIVRTFIFGSFALYTMFLIFSVKSLKKSIFHYNPFGNGYLVAGVLFGIILTMIAIYVPAAQSLLDTVSLPWEWLLGVVGVGILNIAGVELGKCIFRKVV